MEVAWREALRRWRRVVLPEPEKGIREGED